MINTADPSIIADILNKGGIIAYPTEAVWGLGCDPKNQTAVIKLLRIKSRPMSKGMILVAGEKAHLAPWLTYLSKALQSKLLAPCEAPTSWIVADHNISPHWIRGDHQTIALRLSQHIGVQEICHAFKGCIVSTSANPAGLTPALTSTQIIDYFGTQIDAIFDASLGNAEQPSQIKNLLDDQLIRQ